MDQEEKGEDELEMELEKELENKNKNENENSSPLLFSLLRSLDNVLQQVTMAEVAFMISAFHVIETSRINQ